MKMDSTIGKTFFYKRELTGGCRSSILTDRIEFVTYEQDDSPEKKLNSRNKYTELTPDNVPNDKWIVKKKNDSENHIEVNGSLKTNHLVNGCAPKDDVIGTPKISIHHRNKVLLDWSKVCKVGAGLINLGNTCYMNSVLQCLSYCPPLVNHLLYTGENHSSKCKLNSFCMVCEFLTHLQRSYTTNNGAIKPMNIYSRLKSIARHFHPNRQEDAHEFLRYVIDHMWKSYLQNFELAHKSVKLDPRSKETTVINTIFGGYHRSQVTCSQCREKSNTYDYFMDFILDIKDVSNLEDAFKKFTQPEILQNDNAYKCPQCKKKVAAVKRFTVARPPNVATIQFKRFDYNRIYGGKITKKISYSATFNIRPYMCDSKGSPITYKLNAVLVHQGATSNSGHYYCYIKSSNGLWYLMDDERVVQVSLSQVLDQQAYILFYVRSHLQSYHTDDNEKSNCNNSQNTSTLNPAKINGLVNSCRSLTVYPNGHSGNSAFPSRLNGEQAYSSVISKNNSNHNNNSNNDININKKPESYTNGDRSLTPINTNPVKDAYRLPGSKLPLVDYAEDSSDEDDSSNGSPIQNGISRSNSKNQVNGISSKKAEKRLMKLKKKNRKKRKRKKYSEEVEWVERTKETVEKERRIKHQI